MLQGFQHIFVHRIAGKNVVNRYHFLLSLTPKASISLLIKLQRPHKREPNQDMSASLEIQPMSGACGRDKSHLYIPCVPVCNILVSLYIPRLVAFLRQIVRDTLMVMLEPIRHQDALPIGLLDKV